MSETLRVKSVKPVEWKLKEVSMTVEELNKLFKSPYSVSFTIGEERRILSDMISVIIPVDAAKYLDFDDFKITVYKVSYFVERLKDLLGVWTECFVKVYAGDEGWCLGYLRPSPEGSSKPDVEITIRGGEAAYRRGRRVKTVKAEFHDPVEFMLFIAGLIASCKRRSEYKFFKTFFGEQDC